LRDNGLTPRDCFEANLSRWKTQPYPIVIYMPDDGGSLFLSIKTAADILSKTFTQLSIISGIDLCSELEQDPQQARLYCTQD